MVLDTRVRIWNRLEAVEHGTDIAHSEKVSLILFCVDLAVEHSLRCAEDVHRMMTRKRVCLQKKRSKKRDVHEDTEQAIRYMLVFSAQVALWRQTSV